MAAPTFSGVLDETDLGNSNNFDTNRQKIPSGIQTNSNSDENYIRWGPALTVEWNNATSYLCGQFSLSKSDLKTFADGGLVLSASTNTGITQSRDFTILGSDSEVNIYGVSTVPFVFKVAGSGLPSTVDNSGYDPNSIVRFNLNIKRNGSNQVQYFVYNLIRITNFNVYGGETGNYISQAAISSYINSSTFTSEPLSSELLPGIWQVTLPPLSIGAVGQVTRWVESDQTVFIKRRDTNIYYTNLADDEVVYDFSTLRSGDLITWSNITIASNTFFSLNVSNAVGATCTISGGGFDGLAQVSWGADWDVSCDFNSCKMQTGDHFGGSTFQFTASTIAAYSVGSTSANLNNISFTSNTLSPALRIAVAGSFDLSLSRFEGNTTNVVVDGVTVTLNLSSTQFASYTANPANFPVTLINGGTATVTGPTFNFTASELITTTFDNVRCRLSLIPGSSPVTLSDDGTVLSGGLNFAATDVNTTTNSIGLSGIAGKLNNSSVIRFYGSDVPAPIDIRAVYYPSTDYDETDSLKVSTSAGGATLDLTDVGSGSDMYVSIWTELDIDLVTSGDYVVDLADATTAAGVTLESGDILVLQAIHHDPPGTGGSSIISDYLEQSFQYAEASIVSLATLTTATGVMTLVAELGADGSEVTGYIFDANTPGKVQVDVNKADIDSKELLAYYYYVHWLSAGIRKLRGNVIVENLNSIAIIGILTIDSTGRSVMGGPFTYRKDGKNIIADESDQVSFNWESTRAAVVIQEVAYNLSTEMQLLLESTNAIVAQIANTGGALTTTQSSQLASLYGILESSGETTEIINSEALVNTPSVASGGLDKYQGAIWLDTVLGAAGTTVGTHGLYGNPVNNFADAQSLATSMGINRIKMPPDSAFTINGVTVVNLEFIGYSDANEAALATATPNITIINSTVRNCHFSGLFVAATTTLSVFNQCSFSNCRVSFSVASEGSTLVFIKSVVVCSSTTAPLRAANLRSILFRECNLFLVISRVSPTVSGSSFYTFDDCFGSIFVVEITVSALSLTFSGGGGLLTRSASSTVTHNVTFYASFWSAGTGFTASAIGSVPPTIANLPTNFASLAITGGGAITAGTVSDKTGFSLSAGGVQAIWDALTSALATNNSIGKFLVDNIPGIATLLSRLTSGRAGNLDNLDATVSSRSTLTAQQVWEHATRDLTDKVGFALSPAGVAAIEGALLNEGDGQQLIDAIIQVINSSLDVPALELAAIANAVRTNLAVELGRIDATITSRLATGGYTAPLNSGQTQSAVAGALTSYTVPTLVQVQAAGFTSNRNNALVAAEEKITWLARRQGLGTVATVKDAEEGEPGYLTTADGISQVLTLQPDGAVTIEEA